jgi:hypothetical protein
VLARFYSNLDRLYISAPNNDNPTEKAIVCLATKCTKLTQLCLYIRTALTDATILAVAANLVSLGTLESTAAESANIAVPCSLLSAAKVLLSM